jgi:hypothetical protein
MASVLPGHALNALKRPLEPLATTPCSFCEATIAVRLVHLWGGGPRPRERGYRHHRRFIYWLSNGALPPERAGCRDRFAAG